MKHKLISLFLILILIMSFAVPVLGADEEPSTESEVILSDEDVIEHIEYTHGFQNFVEIVSQYKYFCYFQVDSTYYLAVFDVDGFTTANQIRVTDEGELYFWLGWGSIGLYATDENLLFQQVEGTSLLTGVTTNADLKAKFDRFEGIVNFDLSRGSIVIVPANFEAYKNFISSDPTVPEPSEPTTEPTTEPTSESEYDIVEHYQRVDKFIYTFSDILRFAVIVLIIYLCYRWLYKFF